MKDEEKAELQRHTFNFEYSISSFILPKMPLFEYSCRACGKQWTFLSGVVSDNDEPRCPRCASTDFVKLMSRFARGRSDDARMDSLAQRMENSDLDDAQTLRRLAQEAGREMSSESGADLSGEVEQLLESELGGGNFGDLGSGSGDDGTIY